jgi:hypothetical protein
MATACQKWLASAGACEAPVSESPEQARQRWLFARATRQDPDQGSVPILFPGAAAAWAPLQTDPATLAPARLEGKKPKGFFALFKSFLGASLRGFPAEPETVPLLLSSPPSFVRVCGFAPKHAQDAYCYHPVPSLRKEE